MDPRFKLTVIVPALVVLVLIGVFGLTQAAASEPAATAAAMGTGFTYQGRLLDGGGPADGSYDFEFAVYEGEAGGDALATTAIADHPVSDGLFTVLLDFGSDVFVGAARWLEIRVRPGASTGAYTVLDPRQPLAPAPYALALPGLWTRQNSTSPSLIGGHHLNTVWDGVVGGAIGGGGREADGQLNGVTDNYGTVAGGYDNRAGDGNGTVDDATGASVGGGYENRADGHASTVGGGANNIAGAEYTAVGGGHANDAGGERSTIAGGTNSNALAWSATVGGGYSNTVSYDAHVGTIAGGYENVAEGLVATIGGGATNRAVMSYTVVGGGSDNMASGEYATVGGGGFNSASGAFATVAGGGHPDSASSANEAEGAWSTIGGGADNTAVMTYSVVSGGFANNALLEGAAIGGGEMNLAGYWGTVGGGRENRANIGGTVGGGIGNLAGFEDSGGGSITGAGQNATVAGGVSNTASGQSSTVGGGEGNTASGYKSVVAGGWDNQALITLTVVSGGEYNKAVGEYGTVGGGWFNQSSEFGSICGGDHNLAYSWSAVGGGLENLAGWIQVSESSFGSAGTHTAVGGGSGNTASGSYSAVPGGSANWAQGDYSFAAGRRANAAHEGSFVWSDARDFDVTSDRNNQFLISANGGVRLGVNNTDWVEVYYKDRSGTDVLIDTSTGAYLTSSGVWTDLSDRSAKENFARIDRADLLERLASMDVSEWNFIAEPGVRHIGPVAQDFAAAFELGGSDRHLAALDTSGVALAGVQGVYAMAQEQAQRIRSLEAENSALRAQLDEYDGRLTALEGGGQRRLGDLSPTWLWVLAGLLAIAGALAVSRRAEAGKCGR